MDENRRHYRTSPRPFDLQVAVLDPVAQPYLAQVVDVSGGGIRILLAPDAPVTTRLGTALKLRFQSPHLGAPVETVAMVLQSETSEFGVIVGLQFLDWLGLASALPPQLATLFNLRADFRFELDPMSPVPVTVEGIEIGFHVHAVLRDISRGGVSFCAPPVAECALARTDRVLLQFALPGVQQPFRFIGRICYRELVGESVCYGICFEGLGRTETEQQQQALENYIVERCEAAIRELTRS